MLDGTEYWCNIWRKTELCFQIWHDEFSKFSPEHVRGPFIQSRKCMSLKFTWSFVSWQWRMMQYLKRNWLVSSKLTWGIWQVLARALKNLKNLHFNDFVLNKIYNVWAKKSIEEFCLMALNFEATFEGKLTCAFKNDMRNLVNFQQNT